MNITRSSLSLSLSLNFFGFPHLWAKSNFYPSSFLHSYCAFSDWMTESDCPIRHFSYHSLIRRKDFWDISIVQTNHSSFNVTNIRQEHLINVDVTITLGSISSSSCSSGKWGSRLGPWQPLLNLSSDREFSDYLGELSRSFPSSTSLGLQVLRLRLNFLLSRCLCSILSLAQNSQGGNVPSPTGNYIYNQSHNKCLLLIIKYHV